jgi:hypothetical protein
MITQALGERVRDAREVGDHISLSLAAAELQLLNKLGIVAETAVHPQGLYRPGPNFILFCSVVFAERVEELNQQLQRDGGVRSLSRVTEILTEIDHRSDEEEEDDDLPDDDVDFEN